MQDILVYLKCINKRKLAFREDLISWIWANFAKICPHENLYT